MKLARTDPSGATNCTGSKACEQISELHGGAEEQNIRTFSAESADEIVKVEIVARNNARRRREKAMFC